MTMHAPFERWRLRQEERRLMRRLDRLARRLDCPEPIALVYASPAAARTYRRLMAVRDRLAHLRRKATP